MALTKWLPPTRRHTLETDQSRVTWLELFFDLLYVAALIQLGDELSSDVSWGGVGRFVGVFTVLWWTWTGTTAYTNRFAVDDVVHRLLVFLQMFAVANVALFAVGPNDNRWAWLAVAYVASRMPLIAMYVRMLPVGGETQALARVSSAPSRSAPSFGPCRFRSVSRSASPSGAWRSPSSSWLRSWRLAS